MYISDVTAVLLKTATEHKYEQQTSSMSTSTQKKSEIQKTAVQTEQFENAIMSPLR